MINYTNEKLHQLYIEYVFKEEKKTFIDEGLEKYLCFIDFIDNDKVIKIIEDNRQGIFALLDESCAVSSNDEGYLQNLRKTFK